MIDLQLFLGLPIDQNLARQLDQVNSYTKAMFIQEGENYLQEVIFNDRTYLGKKLGKITDSQSLETLEANVYSLLKKLAPGYPTVPLILFSYHAT